MEQEDETENASVLQQVLFSTVVLISVKYRDDLLAQEFHLHEVLVVSTTSSQQQTQQKQAFKTVLNEGPYEKVGISLIETLPEFLQIDPLAKHMLEQITAHKANSELSGSHLL